MKLNEKWNFLVKNDTKNKRCSNPCAILLMLLRNDLIENQVDFFYATPCISNVVQVKNKCKMSCLAKAMKPKLQPKRRNKFALLCCTKNHQ